MAQTVKLSMIVMCQVFCIFMYLNLVTGSITSNTTFGLIKFAQVMFIILLTMALCTNAPKLAVALLQGSPQLSMGEFVAAAGAAMGAMKMTQRAASGGLNATKGAIGGSTRFLGNRLGDMAAMAAGAKAASAVANADGSNGKMAAVRGAMSVLGARTGNRIKQGIQNAATWTGKRGGLGGGGAGGSGGGKGINSFTHDDPGYARSKNTDLSKDNHSINYADSINANGSKRTTGEYMKDQYEGGMNIGANSYLKAESRKFEKAMKKQQKGQNLTLGQRVDDYINSHPGLPANVKDALKNSNVHYDYSRQKPVDLSNVGNNTPKQNLDLVNTTV